MPDTISLPETGAAGAPNLTLSQITAGLLAPNVGWSGSQITYSIPSGTAAWPGYDTNDGSTYYALNSTQAQAFVASVGKWDTLITPSFAQIPDSSISASNPGEIRVAFTNDPTEQDAWGYAYYPPTSGQTPDPVEGDIWIVVADSSDDKLYSLFEAGSYDREALLHELGHALGLKHSFEGDTTIPTQYDTTRYTLMSYTDATDSYLVTFTANSNYIYNHYAFVGPETPMVLDVAAIQARYGADPTTNAGDTTYTFSQSQPFFKTIYDASGTDTIDLSNLTRPSNVDMAPGAYSSIAYYSIDAQISDWQQRIPGAGSFIADTLRDRQAYTYSENLGLSFSTTIENAIGGSGDDTLTGNEISNWIRGGAGADYMRGFSGDDTVDGGAGDDDVNGNMGQDIVHGGDGVDLVRGGQGNDTVYGDAGNDIHVNGSIGNDVVHGGDGDDTVFGGQNDDLVYGDAGNDLISGDLGQDSLNGGPGADLFVMRVGGSADVVQDFDGATGDRVLLTTGVTYALTSAGGSVVITLNAADSLTLSGVAPQAFSSSWIVYT